MLEMKRDWLNRFKAFENVKTRRVIALNENKLHKKQYPNFKYNKPRSDKRNIKRRNKSVSDVSDSNQSSKEDYEKLAFLLTTENLEYLQRFNEGNH